ncbi:MAG: tRNA (adenosine(37)-N6)-threonylcarbamoyltransferase complex dimerization subunit type 1 TsaB [Kineosporiaceae bacterium]
MLLLGLDTSGAAVTVAVHDGHGVVARRSTLDARRHAELLAPSVEAVLTEAEAARTDLTDVAVGVGPGPFTGLRAGIVTARVLGLALGVPVHGVCSLDALALQVAQDPAPALTPGERFVVATDARRHELYWAAYRATGAGDPSERLHGPHVTSPGELPGDVRTFGRGGTLYPDVRATPGPLDVDAGAVAQLAVLALLALGAAGTGDRMSLLLPDPLYLRRPDVAPPGARKRVLR